MTKNHLGFAEDIEPMKTYSNELFIVLKKLLLLHNQTKNNNSKLRNQTHQIASSNFKLNLALFPAKLVRKGFFGIFKTFRFEIKGFIIINIPPLLD